MHLSQQVINAVKSFGIPCPNPLQQQAIVPILKHQHTIIESSTNTDCINTISIACLQLVLPQHKYTQSLILVPQPSLVTSVHTVCRLCLPSPFFKLCISSLFCSLSLFFCLSLASYIYLYICYLQTLTAMSATLPGLNVCQLSDSSSIPVEKEQPKHILITTPSTLALHLRIPSAIDLHLLELLIILNCDSMDTPYHLTNTGTILNSIPPSAQIVLVGFE